VPQSRRAGQGAPWRSDVAALPDQRCTWAGVSLSRRRKRRQWRRWRVGHGPRSDRPRAEQRDTV